MGNQGVDILNASQHTLSYLINLFIIDEVVINIPTRWFTYYIFYFLKGD